VIWRSAILRKFQERLLLTEGRGRLIQYRHGKQSEHLLRIMPLQPWPICLCASRTRQKMENAIWERKVLNVVRMKRGNHARQPGQLEATTRVCQIAALVVATQTEGARGLGAPGGAAAGPRWSHTASRGSSFHTQRAKCSSLFY
jgi:hypothetical protein